MRRRQADSHATPNAVKVMKRTLIVVTLCVAGTALPARADATALSPESTYTNVGCGSYGGGFFGEQTHTTEPSLTGRIRNGVSLSSGLVRDVDDDVLPAIGRCESVSALSVTDELASGLLPSYTATITVRGATGARVGPGDGLPQGAQGEFLVMALLRVTDGRCSGQVTGSDPAVLADASGVLSPGAVVDLVVTPPAACVKARPTTLQVQVSIYARVAMSDRKVDPITGRVYDAPGFGSASALADVDVVLTRTS